MPKIQSFESLTGWRPKSTAWRLPLCKIVACRLKNEDSKESSVSFANRNQQSAGRKSPRSNPPAIAGGTDLSIRAKVRAPNKIFNFQFANFRTRALLRELQDRTVKSSWFAGGD